MKKYDLFNLYLVELDQIRYICVKDEEENKYTEIFTSKKITNNGIMNIKALSQYYEILVMKSYLSGESVYLTKDELLLEFLKINSYNLYKNNQNNYVDNIIKKQKEYQELFNELSIRKPEKAKEIARKSLEKLGILSENGGLKSPYDEVFEKEDNEVKKLTKEIKK